MSAPPASTDAISGAYGKVERLRTFLREHPSPPGDASTATWYAHLAGLKAVLGDFHSTVHAVAVQMAMEYLARRFQLANSEGHPPRNRALNLDIRTRDGRRIAAMVKTTAPIHVTEPGPQQKREIGKALAAVAEAQAEERILFVTERHAFDSLRRLEHAAGFSGIRIILLGADEEEFIVA